MTSRAARRRRAKGKGMTLPGGEVAPQPVTQGARRAEPANRVGLDARKRKLGDLAHMAQHPAAGCDVGRVLIRQGALDLWPAVAHVRRVCRAYRAACGAPSPHAQSLGILLPPDRLEASADAPAPDLRTDDERHRQAVTAWTTLHGWLAYTDNAAASACIRHVFEEREEPIRDVDGLLSALRCISEGMAGKVPTYRARRAP